VGWYRDCWVTIPAGGCWIVVDDNVWTNTVDLRSHFASGRIVRDERRVSNTSESRVGSRGRNNSFDLRSHFASGRIVRDERRVSTVALESNVFLHVSLIGLNSSFDLRSHFASGRIVRDERRVSTMASESKVFLDLSLMLSRLRWCARSRLNIE